MTKQTQKFASSYFCFAIGPWLDQLLYSIFFFKQVTPRDVNAKMSYSHVFPFNKMQQHLRTTDAKMSSQQLRTCFVASLYLLSTKPAGAAGKHEDDDASCDAHVYLFFTR